MKTSELNVLTVGGTPRERGRAIGESLREDIHEVMEKHDQAIDNRPGYSVKDYYAAFDKFSAHLDAAKKWAPGLLEEVWGMAEGAYIEPERMFRFQLIDEDWYSVWRCQSTWRAHLCGAEYGRHELCRGSPGVAAHSVP